MKTVLVFKTSVSENREVEELRPVLNELMRAEEKWNFDLEDCDRILRVESQGISSAFISAVMNKEGYRCVELED